MAMSLTACGGSDDVVVDITSDNADAILAAVVAVDASATTVQDVADNAAAAVDITSDNTDVMLSQADYDGALEDAVIQGVVQEAQATVDLVNETLGTSYDLDAGTEVLITALIESDNTDVMLSQADYDAALAEATLSDNTDVMLSQADYDAALDATEADAFSDGAASRDDEVANLQAQLDNLLAADAALDARTLDADNETFAAGDAADFDIIVSGTTAGADTLTATVTGAGTGTLSFSFADEDDVVILTAADLSSYSAIEISAGAVDLTAVTIAAGVDIEINSKAFLTGEQLLNVGSVNSNNGTGKLSVLVSSAAQGEAIAAIISARVEGVAAENLEFVNAENSTATDAEMQALEDAAGLALTVAAASVDPVGAITAAVANVEAEQLLVDAANSALADARDAAVVAEAQATLDAASNEVVAEALGDENVEVIAAAVADTATGVVQDILEHGTVIDDAVSSAVLAANDSLAGAVPSLTTVDGVFTDSPTLFAAKISDARDQADTMVSEAEDALVASTEDLNEAHGLAINRYNNLLEDEAVQEAAETALNAAKSATDEAIEVTQAIIAIGGAGATINSVVVDGNITNVSIDGDGTEVEFDPVNLFVFNGDVAAFDTDVVTTNADNSNKYDVAGTDVTVTKSFIDDVLVTFQAQLDAQNALAEAAEVVAASTALLEAAVDAESGAAFANSLLGNYIAAVEGLNNANSEHDLLEAIISSYETVTELAAGIASLEAAVTAADEAVVARADTTDVDAAILAVQNALNGDPAGLNVSYSSGLGGGNSYVYADVLTGDQVVDTAALDIIDFGAGYVFTTVAADADVITDAVGDANVLEVLLQQNSGDDGLPTTVSVWIESAAADGSSSITSAANFTLTNAQDNLSLADLDFTSFDGLMVTGVYDTGLIA